VSENPSQPAAAAAAPSDRIRARVLLRVLAPFALGYFMSYLFRAVNAVVAPDLVRDLGLNASDLGLLTAAYLLAFAAFQLPIGILLDRFGPRNVQAGLLMIAACGALLFAFGGDAVTLMIARALIGLGVAGSLMSGFKAVVLWVAKPRQALANSWVMSVGAIGLLVSTAPTEWAVRSIGWRGVFIVLAGITALVALLIATVVPERRDLPTGTTLGAQLKTLGGIFADRAFLLLAPLLATSAGTHIAIQTLWAGPWFRDIAGLDRAGVAESLFLMAAAFFVGILFTGWVADWFQRRGVDTLTVMLGFLAVFMLSQFAIITLPSDRSLPAWLAFGMTGQVAILAYPWLSHHFGTALSGRANTAMNLLIFMSAFLVQWAIGWIIDGYPKSATGGYAPDGYRAAFGGFLALEVATLVAYLAGRRRLFAHSA
jgi:MFS family permease